MFRIQDNVPEVYINESRDFLILARLYDVLFSGVRYDIGTLTNLLSSIKLKDRLLLLLCTKVGFFPTIDLDANVLKHILASFPFIIKNKGTLIGLEAAVRAVVQTETNIGENFSMAVLVVGEYLEELKLEPYTVYVLTSKPLKNTHVLSLIMPYVIPFGYAYLNLLYGNLGDTPILTQIDTQNNVSIYSVKSKVLSRVSTSDTYAASTTNIDTSIGNAYINEVKKLLFGYNMAEVIGSDHDNEPDETTKNDNGINLVYSTNYIKATTSEDGGEK